VATGKFIRQAHDIGLQVHVWTLNTRAEMERALDLMVDGVMTDDVVLLRDVLAARGQWNSPVPAVPADAGPPRR
jgi:glycerophosphoryl diester phosphodiesterase